MLDDSNRPATADEAYNTELMSRRRVLRGTAAGVAAIGTAGVGIGTVGTRTAAARRYDLRRVRSDTPGQSVIEDVVLVHDRRVVREDVFYRSVSLADYAMKYDRQRIAVSAADDWGWDAPVFGRQMGSDRTRRLLPEFDLPFYWSVRAVKPLAIKVWTETDPGRGD